MPRYVQTPRHLDDPVRFIHSFSLGQIAGAVVGAGAGGLVWWTLARLHLNSRIVFPSGTIVFLSITALCFYLVSNRAEPYGRQLLAFLTRHRLYVPSGERGEEGGPPRRRPPFPPASSNHLIGGSRRGAPSALSVDTRGVITLPDGSLRAILRVKPINLAGRTEADREALADDFGAMLNNLSTRQRLHVLIDNRSVEAQQVLDEISARHKPKTQALREYHKLWLPWLREQLENRHVADLNYYIIIESASVAEGGLEVALQGKSEFSDQQGLEQALRDVTDALERMELDYTLLERREVIELLWSSLHLSGDPCPSDGELAMVSSPRRPRLRLLHHHLHRARVPTRLRRPPPTRQRDQGISVLHERLCGVTVSELWNALKVDGCYCRSLFILRIPDKTDAGWLDRLVHLPFRTRMSIIYAGLEMHDELRRLIRMRGQIDVINDERVSRGGVADVYMSEADQEFKRLLEETQDVSRRFLRMGIYITVFARSESELTERVNRVKATIRYAQAEVGYGLWDQLPLFQSTLPLCLDVARHGYRTTTPAAGNTFPFTLHSPGHRTGYPLGFIGNELVMYDPTSTEMANSLVNVVGMTGSGKTFLALKLALSTLMQGGRVTVVVKAGHYQPLLHIAGGSYVRFLDSTTPPAINPWEFLGAARKTQVKELVNMHEIMLARKPGDRLSAWERALLEEGVRAVFSQHDDGSLPLERELVAWLHAAAERRPERRDVIENLAYGLRPYAGDGEYASLIDRQTNIDLDANMLVFDLSQLAGSQSAIAMFLIASVVERRALRHGQRDDVAAERVRELLIVDEGWFIVKYAGGGEWIEWIARTGRHLGLFAAFLTQQLSDLLTDAEAVSLFNAASVTFLFRQSDERVGDLGTIFKLSESEVRTLGGLRSVRGEYSEAFMILKSQGSSKPRGGAIRIMSSPMEYFLFASHADEQALRDARVRQYGGNIWKAVKSLALDRPPRGA